MEKISVRVGGRAGCPACDAGKGCGAGVFSRLARRRPVILELRNSLGSVVGQPVVIGLPEPLLLRLVFRSYLYPLLAGLAGAAFGHYLSVRIGAGAMAVDVAALLGAVLAASVVLMWNRKREIEFPSTNAVHVLRHTDRSVAGACDRPIIVKP